MMKRSGNGTNRNTIKHTVAFITMTAIAAASLLAGCSSREEGTAGYGNPDGSGTASWEAFSAQTESEKVSADADTVGSETDASGPVPDSEQAVYVRTITDAGEDDAEHPLDVAIEKGTAGKDYPEISEDLTALSEENQDVLAILKIPAVGLEYPVMWFEYENQYYLEHDIDGNESESGCIELDGWNASDLTDVSSILYGHNMRDLSMFGSLKRMLGDETLALKEPYVYLYTAEGRVLAYRIFAYNVTTDTDPAYELPELEYPVNEETAAAAGAASGDAASYRKLGELLGWEMQDEEDTTGDTEPATGDSDSSDEQEMNPTEAAGEEAGASEGTEGSDGEDRLTELYAAADAQEGFNQWYDEYVDKARQDSAFAPEETPDFSKRPRLLMLATCYGAQHSNNRFLVHCVLEKEFD